MSSGRVRRRLAAIVVADVVGYSRLSGIDEVGTVSALKKHRRELIDDRITYWGGRIVKTLGDGLLLDFPSVVDAISCSVDIQAGMIERNRDIPEARRLVFRFGVNVGDIMEDGDDILGDGVNIAARLEAVAPPGGIVISDTARDGMAGKLDLEIHDMGRIELKNINRPIQVFRVTVDRTKITSGTIEPEAPLAIPSPAAAKAEAPTRSTGPLSVALLPFRIETEDPRLPSLGNDICEDVVADLARIATLAVVPWEASAIKRDPVLDVRHLGRELGAEYLLRGTLRLVEGRLRVTIQLFHPESGAQVWTHRLEQSFVDPARARRSVAIAIAASARLELGVLARDRLGRTTNRQGRTAPAGHADRGLLEAFLAGAQIEGIDLDRMAAAEPLLRTIGDLLRLMVGGLQKSLRARSRMKEEMKLEATVIVPEGANPIKLATTPEAALRLMLLAALPGHLPPLASAREGFVDIDAHQSAILVGIQAALARFLSQFDPESLKRNISQASVLDLMLDRQKARYWEGYEQTYRSVLAQAQAGFHEAFGQEFQRAYEEYYRRQH